jgi:hypothetical protein
MRDAGVIEHTLPTAQLSLEAVSKNSHEWQQSLTRWSKGISGQEGLACMTDALPSEGRAQWASGAAADSEKLSAMHQRLAAHFGDLHDRRDRLGRAPVFALEHGLSAAELAELEAGIRSAASRSRFPAESWLPLVVYATELGYRYSGNEYWQTFESQTPGWAETGDRKYVRTIFEEFSDTFGGARPSGAWASWFSIISWPVTHAVLPADLQRQFARLIFDYRAALTADLLAEPRALGLKLAARAGHYSRRFQSFAQNTDLLGQVAAALLVGDDEESPYLLNSTLGRLVGSLYAEKQAKRWLQDTRRRAREVRTRGFLPATYGRASPARPQPPRLPSITDPAVSLRRGPTGWAAYLTVPDLSVLGERLPGIQDEIGRLRPRVAGASQAALPRGQLLFPGRQVRLATWPDAHVPIIQLEGGQPSTNAVLADQCVLSPGPSWIFQIRDRGLATEVRGKIIRPGGLYTLIRRGGVKPGCLPEWVTPADCSTAGVHAYDVRAPSHIDDRRAEEARSLGLAIKGDISIRPAGMVAADWDGQGAAGWLAGEDIILALRSTSSIARGIFELAGIQHFLTWPAGADEIFVTVAGLGTGVHEARISLLAPEADKPVTCGTFIMTVRDPSSRPPGGTLREGLSMIASPATPSLPEIWDGRAAIQVLGPPGGRARAEVALTDGRHRVIAVQGFGIEIPLDLQGWRRLTATRLRQSPQFQQAYDEAESCVITVSDYRLGVAELQCEREFAPLRWIVGANHDGPFARLVDNTEDRHVTVDCFGFSSPDQPARIAPFPADGRMREPAGGLLRAQTGNAEAAVILPPRVRDLADLQLANVHPRLSAGPRTADEALRLVDVARMWASAALPANPLAQHEQRSVLRAIAKQLGCLICGQRWARLERRMRGDVPAIGALQEAVGTEAYQTALARLIRSRLGAWATERPENRAADLGSLLAAQVPRSRLGLGHARRAELLLRLASDPSTVAAWSRHEVSAAIEQAIVVPVLMRAARFAVLAIHAATAEDTGTVYRGWEWR